MPVEAGGSQSSTRSSRALERGAWEDGELAWASRRRAGLPRPEELISPFKGSIYGKEVVPTADRDMAFVPESLGKSWVCAEVPFPWWRCVCP